MSGPLFGGKSHPGFAKGTSGNPGGRTKALKEVEALARTHTEEAIEILMSIGRNEDAPSAARVSAVSTILDRGWGKAKQTVDLGVNAGALPDDALQQRIAERLGEILAGPGTTGADGGGAPPDDQEESEGVLH